MNRLSGLSFPHPRDCEKIIQIWLNELFTTENTKSTEKINLLFQGIKNFVFSVFSVVILYFFSKNEYFHNLWSVGMITASFGLQRLEFKAGFEQFDLE